MKLARKMPIMAALGIGMLLPLGTMNDNVAMAASEGIHVDQVGYLEDYSKVAMISLKGDSKDFSLVDTATGKTVYQGKLTDKAYDEMSGEYVARADFSDFKVPGTYKLVAGGEESADFAIGKNVYAVPALQNWRSYTLSRSNTPMNDKLTGLKIVSGHAQDKEAQVYFTDKLNKKGDVVDASGGWYDAGDYGKYTTTAAIASAELMMAYEANPDKFFKGQLFFPEGVQEENMPDALSEVKFELEFMKKMQRSDGSTFHKISGAQWPGFDKSPDTDTQQRYLYSTCTASTAMYGASMAMAGRVYADIDKAFAKDCLKNAEKAWAYLAKEKESVYRVDEGQESGSGPYNDTADATERCWLAAELFRTTGDKKYEKYLMTEQKDVITRKPSFFTWDDTLALAQFSYAKAAKANPEFRAKVQAALISYADDIVDTIGKDGFDCSLKQNEYTWASTKNAVTKGDILLLANQLAPKQAYVEGALSQIHYMFGRNVLNKSFMTGVGENPPEHPHNRIHESTGAYVPGLLVGGPNAVSGGDPDQTEYIAKYNPAPAKCYIDVLMSWSTNEYAIDYCGAGIYALSYFMQPDKNIKADDLKLTRDFPLWDFK